MEPDILNSADLPTATLPSNSSMASPTSMSDFLANHTTLVGHSGLSPDDKICAICRVPFGELDPESPSPGIPEYALKVVAVGGCAHVLGNKCLYEHIFGNQTYSNKCPVCRTQWFPAPGNASGSRRAAIAPDQVVINSDTDSDTSDVSDDVDSLGDMDFDAWMQENTITIDLPAAIMELVEAANHQAQLPTDPRELINIIDRLTGVDLPVGDGFNQMNRTIQDAKQIYTTHLHGLGGGVSQDNNHNDQPQQHVQTALPNNVSDEGVRELVVAAQNPDTLPRDSEMLARVVGVLEEAADRYLDTDDARIRILDARDVYEERLMYMSDEDGFTAFGSPDSHPAENPSGDEPGFRIWVDEDAGSTNPDPDALMHDAESDPDAGLLG